MNQVISSFAQKGLNTTRFFNNNNNNNNNNVFEEGLGNDCSKCRFAGNCGESFDKKYPNSHAMSGKSEDLGQIIKFVDDINTLGPLLFSQWRYITYRNMEAINSDEVTELFKIALSRLDELNKLSV